MKSIKCGRCSLRKSYEYQPGAPAPGSLSFVVLAL
jgi:hypothetical protein